MYECCDRECCVVDVALECCVRVVLDSVVLDGVVLDSVVLDGCVTVADRADGPEVRGGVHIMLKQRSSLCRSGRE